METARELQQLLQINDLVIAPVADIAPGVIRLFDFPVDTLFGNSIRVVAVHRGRVDELGDHILDKFRITERQRLPVLEDVAPVALVGQQSVAVFVFQLDRELVPGTARIAMAAAKRDRQVFVARRTNCGSSWSHTFEQARSLSVSGSPSSSSRLRRKGIAIKCRTFR